MAQRVPFLARLSARAAGKLRVTTAEALGRSSPVLTNFVQHINAHRRSEVTHRFIASYANLAPERKAQEQLKHSVEHFEHLL